MKFIKHLFLLFPIFIACDTKKERGSIQKPNILFIIADDMGYSDIGAFGGEIDTPNLDQLAKSGVVFSRFYATPACAPTRAMLLTGLDSHLTGIGSFPKLLAENQKGKPGYEEKLNDRVTTIPSLLKMAGYQNYMVGKWHLGNTNDSSSPHNRGFDKAWDYTKGTFDHFGLVSKAYENGKEISLPTDFYSTNFMSNKMLDYLEHHENSKPFFAYMAYTAPHFPLAAPDKYLEKYKGKYSEGYGHLREERFKRIKAIGMAAEDESLSQWPQGVKPWDSISDDKRKFSSKAMQAYAAMVDNLDMNIGKLMDFLKMKDLYDNTLVIFMSDNGASGLKNNTKSSHLAKRKFKDDLDNTYENIGKPYSVVAYGSGWAQSATPYRDFKHTTSEGGVRVPAIFGGGYLKENHGTIKHSFSSILDVMPTLLELAEVDYPLQKYPPIKGKSLINTIKGLTDNTHEEDYIYGLELAGDRCIYAGDWKLVSNVPPIGDGKWKLYKITDDPQEQNDLLGENPDKLKEMITLWESYKAENGVVIAEPESPIKVMLRPIGN